MSDPTRPQALRAMLIGIVNRRAMPPRARQRKEELARQHAEADRVAEQAIERAQKKSKS